MNRSSVLGGAIGLIDAQGLAAFTMRGLGGQLGVEAMTLYLHVESRNELLDSAADAVMDELVTDAWARPQPSDRAPEYLRRLAFGIRDLALQHPQVFLLVATRPTSEAWLRPPLRSVRWVDAFIETLRARGFSDAEAVHTYRAFTAFLHGHLLLEVAARGEARRVGAPNQLYARRYTAARLPPALVDHQFEREFSRSVELLLSDLTAEQVKEATPACG